MSDNHTTAATGITTEEMFESLTGFEEIAIRKHFNVETNVAAFAETDPLMLLRALVFVHLCRGGARPNEARTEALGLTIKQATAYFEPEEFEPDPDNPSTLSGKDDGLDD